MKLFLIIESVLFILWTLQEQDWQRISELAIKDSLKECQIVFNRFSDKKEFKDYTVDSQRQ